MSDNNRFRSSSYLEPEFLTAIPVFAGSNSVSSKLPSSRFNTSKYVSENIVPISLPLSKKVKSDASKTPSPIDAFYDNRKQLYDICGNTLNKEKYPFISILSTYLVDIVNSIDIEINKSTRNSMVNWREKKNPKLLSKFINSDDNINLINRSMNKITAGNYMIIAAEITDTLMKDNFRKLPEYSVFLFDVVIKKCLNDEKFAEDYLNFLVAFEGVIGKNINQSINKFISEMFSLLQKNNSLKDTSHFGYFSYIKDSAQYMSLGIIFANIYLIHLKYINSSKIKMMFSITDVMFYSKFIACLNNIKDLLEWVPNDIDDLNSRIYLVFGIIETLGNSILENMVYDDKQLLNEVLTLIYNMNSIPNKIKFKVLDIQDMVKTFEKERKVEQKDNILKDTVCKVKEPVVVVVAPAPTPTPVVAPALVAIEPKPIQNITPLTFANVSSSGIVPKATQPIQSSPQSPPLQNQDIYIPPKTNKKNVNEPSNLEENQSSNSHQNDKNRNRFRRDSRDSRDSRDTRDSGRDRNRNPNPSSDTSSNKSRNYDRNHDRRRQDNTNNKNHTIIENKSVENVKVAEIQKAPVVEEDDGFIKIERKGKTTSSSNNSIPNTTEPNAIYKPKKTNNYKKKITT